MKVLQKKKKKKITIFPKNGSEVVNVKTQSQGLNFRVENLVQVDWPSWNNTTSFVKYNPISLFCVMSCGAFFPQHFSKV